MWTHIFDEHGASEALIDTSTWPGYGLHVGTAEDAQKTQQKRRMIELFQSSSRHTLSMCSEERYSEYTGGLWSPGIGFSALLASYRGRVGMSLAQDRLKMRFSGRTKKFRVWTNVSSRATRPRETALCGPPRRSPGPRDARRLAAWIRKSMVPVSTFPKAFRWCHYQLSVKLS